jgi:hypothetical protein
MLAADAQSLLLREQFSEDEREDPAVAVVIDLDRGIDPAPQLDLLLCAIRR